MTHLFTIFSARELSTNTPRSPSLQAHTPPPGKLLTHDIALVPTAVLLTDTLSPEQSR